MFSVAAAAGIIAATAAAVVTATAAVIAATAAPSEENDDEDDDPEGTVVIAAITAIAEHGYDPFSTLHFLAVSVPRGGGQAVLKNMCTDGDSRRGTAERVGSALKT